MIEVSTAKTIYTIATFSSIAAGIITVSSVFLIYWSTNVIDRNAEQKISAAHSAAAIASKDAAEANLKAEKTRQQNLQLQIDLSKQQAALLQLRKQIF